MTMFARGAVCHAAGMRGFLVLSCSVLVACGGGGSPDGGEAGGVAAAGGSGGFAGGSAGGAAGGATAGGSAAGGSTAGGSAAGGSTAGGSTAGGATAGGGSAGGGSAGGGAPLPATLTVMNVRRGSATGSVTSMPAGINCGSTCEVTFDGGTMVELTATPGARFTFEGWAGDCTGTSRTCTLQVDRPRAATATFTPYNTVFATSGLIAPMLLGGIANADAICAAHAADAGFEGEYVAWMSTSTTSARTRMNDARGWVRPDGKPFADTMTELLQGQIFYPVRLTEKGQDLGSSPPNFNVGPNSVATGTSASGSAYQTCADWTADAGLQYGDVQVATSGWTQMGINRPCTVPTRLLCMSRSYKAPVEVVAPAQARRAFISTAWLVGGGLAGADAKCQADAVDAGVPGQFQALLSTTSASAASRFNAAGANWVRVDNVPVAANGAALLSGSRVVDAALNVTARGAYVTSPILQGAFTLTGVGTATCSNWTSDAGTSIGGGSSQITTTFYSGGTYPSCASNAWLVCLQQ
ncbi:MAG: hypothetical protein JNK82_28490 [Myxococcaceae bacterium]|nr:hypothetical protein [Myxococcaceae bacterium]